MTLSYVLHRLDRVEQKLDSIISLLHQIAPILSLLQSQGVSIMADLSTIQTEVAANTNAIQSAITLLTQLSDLLHAAANDPAQVRAIADQLKANSQSLADAVVANTPSAPTPPVP